MTSTRGVYQQQLRKITQLHNDCRTLEMNQKYYGSRLTVFRRFQLIADLIVAGGSTTSAISGWLLWSSPPGKITWGIITAIATILAIAKPALKTNKKIEVYSKLFGEYAVLHAKTIGLINSIRVDGYLSKTKEQSSSRLLQRVEPLSKLEDPKPSRRLMAKCQDQVNEEYPVTSLWLPTYQEFCASMAGAGSEAKTRQAKKRPIAVSEDNHVKRTD